MGLMKHLYPKGKSWRCSWNIYSKGTDLHQMVLCRHFRKKASFHFLFLLKLCKVQVQPYTITLNEQATTLGDSGAALTGYMKPDSDDKNGTFLPLHFPKVTFTEHLILCQQEKA